MLSPSRLIPAALGTALFAWLVPVNETLAGKAAVLLVVWLGLAYGIQVCADLFTGGVTRAARPARRDPRPALVPPLDAHSRAAVADIVALFRQAGVFEPEAPQPEVLHEAVADLGVPVTQGIVLTALQEAPFHHPRFDPSACLGRLAFHASHAERSRDRVEREAADLVRLSGAALDVGDLPIDLRPDGRKSLAIGHPVAIARALRSARAPRRLAWLWTDQGAWITGLGPDTLERLNAGPGGPQDGGEGWSWMDEWRQ
jgi:hypothetical protein